ncbi:MAG: hypothetical protein IH947_15755 [Bacteroidetes bacterium]|nr:hypothetical protein [Bacteroidota bacterium]
MEKYKMCSGDVLGKFFGQIVIIDANATIACANDSSIQYMINTIAPYQFEVPEISDEEYEVYLAVLKHFYPATTLFTIWWETTATDEAATNLQYLYEPDYPYGLAIEFFYYEKEEEVTALDVNGFTDPGVDIVLLDQQDLAAVNSFPWWLEPDFFEAYKGTNGMNFFTRAAIKDNYAMLLHRWIHVGTAGSASGSGEEIHVLLKKDTEGWQVIRSDIWTYID